MPKGVYDRSKTKAQRAAEKKNSTPAVEAAPVKAEKIGRRAKTAAAPAAPEALGAGVVNDYANHQKLQTLIGIYTSLSAGLNHLDSPDLIITAQRAINNTIVRIEVLSEELIPLEKAHGIKKAAAEVNTPSIEERAEVKATEKAHKVTNGAPAPVPVPVPVPVPFNNAS